MPGYCREQAYSEPIWECAPELGQPGMLLSPSQQRQVQVGGDCRGLGRLVLEDGARVIFDILATVGSRAYRHSPDRLDRYGYIPWFGQLPHEQGEVATWVVDLHHAVLLDVTDQIGQSTVGVA